MAALSLNAEPVFGCRIQSNTRSVCAGSTPGCRIRSVPSTTFACLHNLPLSPVTAPDCRSRLSAQPVSHCLLAEVPMFKTRPCPQSLALFQEHDHRRRTCSLFAKPLCRGLSCFAAVCDLRAPRMKGLFYDDNALESCRWGGFLPGAQSTGGRGLRTLALVSSLFPPGLGWTSTRASQPLRAAGTSTYGSSR